MGNVALFIVYTPMVVLMALGFINIYVLNVKFLQVAQEVCDSIQASLMNRRVNMFETIQNAVREALKEVIERILLPG